MPEPVVGPLRPRAPRLWALLATACLALPAAAESGLSIVNHVPLDTVSDPRFGGLSAVEVSADGTRALALSDRGTLFTLTLTRQGDRITALAIEDAVPLSAPGIPSDPDRAEMDAEGLARRPGGAVAIAFEGVMRIGIHDLTGAETARIPAPPGWQDLPPNGGFEALAIDATRQVFTLAEDQTPDTPMSLFVWDGAAWRIAAEIAQTPGYRPVALAFDDRGRLYLLERRFSVFAGFSNQLTRLRLGPGTTVTQEIIATFPAGQFGNLEGLSLWRRADGTLIATLVSDDNFLPFLPAVLVEIALPDYP